MPDPETIDFAEADPVKIIPVAVSSEQILALHDAPPTVIPAQGPGTIVKLERWANQYTFGNSPYGLDSPAIFIYEGQTVGIDTTAAGAFRDCLTSTQDYSSAAPCGMDGFATADIVNKAVQLWCDTANPHQFGSIASSSVGDPGSGYEAGDTGFILVGSNTTYTVLSVDGGGGVLTFSTSDESDVPVGDGALTQKVTGAGDEVFTINIDTLSNGSNGTLALDLTYTVDVVA